MRKLEAAIQTLDLGPGQASPHVNPAWSGLVQQQPQMAMCSV